MTPPPPSSIPPNEWEFWAIDQRAEGKVYHLKGNAWIIGDSTLFQAQEIEWNEETGEVRASGDVYYHNFERKMELWCDHLEYDSDTKSGKFYKVRGKAAPKIVTRPDVLTSSSPFYFEGEWAEKEGNLYSLHNGFMTNCNMPNPWWRLRGPRFTIEPGVKAEAKSARFLLHGVPIFYTPYFYHSLAPEPRQSGFLMPNLGNSSNRGVLLGAGYYWAINRSYDTTYRLTYYTARGFAHHVDLRGRPREGTDFYAIIYGVNDRGRPNSNPREKFSGVSIYGVGNSDLGKGWTARANINYTTQFRFRQEWSQSYNELLGSEIHSVGFVNKSFQNYTFDLVFARLENFQDVERRSEDPVTHAVTYTPNVVTIRKLPEAVFSGRSRRLSAKLPFWFSFESSAGLVHRSVPVFNSDGTQLVDRFVTGQFMNRVNLMPHISAPIHVKGLNIIPSFGIQETYYAQGQEPFEQRYRTTGTNIVRSAQEFSLDLIFPSLQRVFAKKTFLGDKLKHVIEPRVTYRYVTGVGEKFNRFIRFDETDLLSDTNEVLLSVTNRLYAKRNGVAQEILTWDVMQKRYFNPTFGGALTPGQRNVFETTTAFAAYGSVVEARSTSPIISLLRVSPVPGWGVLWQSDYDPRLGALTNSSLSVDYRWHKYFASAGNNIARSDPAVGSASQDGYRANEYRFRMGFGDPNNRGWNAAFDGIYDRRLSELKYSTTQVTYNTDCCGFSIQLHRYRVGLRDDTTWRVAFMIANIGSFGTLRKQDRLF